MQPLVKDGEPIKIFRYSLGRYAFSRGKAVTSAFIIDHFKYGATVVNGHIEKKMFVGRERELQDLEQQWHSESFALPVIYGRRRIGKTSLLEKFSSDKDAIFFTPVLNGEDNIVALADLARKSGIETAGESLSQILADIFRAGRTRRLLFIIDEYPYLENSNHGASSELQKLVDKNPDSRLFLVLCGSSMNFIKRQVLGYESPLFGRRTAQLFIEPFTLFQSLRLLPGADFTSACEFYGLVDGTPAYLAKLDPEKSFRENLLTAFLKTSSYLFEESEALIKQELKQPALHSAILNIVNSKALIAKEIQDKMANFEVDKNKCVNMIENLADIGILERISAWREPKKEAWRIADCYFSFWHSFMPRIFQAVKNNQAKAAADFVEKHYSNYMGGVFEKICVQWLQKESASGRLLINATNFGKWWGTDNRIKKQAEIDIVADDFDGNMLFGECKWQNAPMDADQIDKLVQRSALVKKNKDCEQAFYFFSKSGFTPQAIETAGKMDGCRLVSLSGGEPEEEFSPQGLSFKI